jgi:mycofactocin precursor
MSQTNPSSAAAPVVESAGAPAGSPAEPGARLQDELEPKARPDGGPAPTAPPQSEPKPPAPPEDELVEADLLVEDISIDGMCGVY